MKDKILLLDDDPVQLEYLRAIIEKNIAADIVIETNRIRATERIKNEEEFSIFIICSKEQNEQGFEIAQEVQEMKCDIPIILLADIGGIDQIKDWQIINMNIYDIVNKTEFEVNNSLLINKIKIHIEKHKSCKRKRAHVESKYKELFDNSTVALWEEDLTTIKAMLADLSKAIGQENVKAYLDNHPNFVDRALSKIIVKKINKKAIDMFGAESENQLKTSIKQTFTEDSYDVFKRLLLAFSENKKEFSSDVQYKTFQNKCVDARIFVNIPENEKDYCSVVFSMVDLSYIKTLEKKSQSAYNAITKSPVIVLTLLPTETYFTIDFISENIFSILNYTPQDFKDGKVSLEGIVHQDDIGKQISLFKEQIALKNKDFYLKFRIYAKDHSIKWVKMIISPSWNSHEEISCLQCVAIDVTQEMILQKKLTDSLTKLKTLIESTNTAYIILDERGIIEEANERMISLLGCKETSDLVGKSPRAIISKQDIAKYDSAIEKLLMGESVENLELNIHSSNFLKCSATWISMNAGLFENGKRKIFCLMRDITELKLQEVKRFILNQKKRDMLRQNILKIRDKLKEMDFRNKSGEELIEKSIEELNEGEKI
jgi:PAS domain S-box-containing protein